MGTINKVISLFDLRLLKLSTQNKFSLSLEIQYPKSYILLERDFFRGAIGIRNHSTSITSTVTKIY